MKHFYLTLKWPEVIAVFLINPARFLSPCNVCPLCALAHGPADTRSIKLPHVRALSLCMLEFVLKC